MNGAWDGLGWAVWLGNAQLAAGAVILAAGVSVAWVLFGLNLKVVPASASRPPRVLMLFSTLVALCGIAHLGVLLSGLAPGPVVTTTALKVTAAALWVAAAVRFRSVVARIASPCPPADGTAGAPDEHARIAYALKLEQLKIKARMLDNMIQNETWLTDKADALRELRDIVAGLEAEQCPI